MVPSEWRPAAAALALLLLGAGGATLYSGSAPSTTMGKGTTRVHWRHWRAFLTLRPTTAVQPGYEELISAVAGNFSDVLGVVILVTNAEYSMPNLRIALTLLAAHLAPHTPLRVCVCARAGRGRGRGRTCTP